MDETTATLPEGWRERLVPIRNENTRGATGWCLEVHDLAVSKLIAGREKDSPSWPGSFATGSPRLKSCASGWEESHRARINSMPPHWRAFNGFQTFDVHIIFVPGDALTSPGCYRIGMDFLVTWNFRHIANAVMEPLIREVCVRHGWRCPEICTPEQLLPEEKRESR